VRRVINGIPDGGLLYRFICSVLEVWGAPALVDQRIYATLSCFFVKILAFLENFTHPTSLCQ